MGSEIRQRLIIIAVVLAVAILFLVPSVMKFSGLEVPKVISRYAISLGLDLSGGVNLVYQVQAIEAVKSRLQNSAISLKKEFKEAKIAAIRVRVNEQGQLEAVFLTQTAADAGKTKILEGYKDLTFVRQDSDEGKVKLLFGVTDKVSADIQLSAINQAVETLSNRINNFGVTEPLIQRVGNDRINLQMPGVQDVQTVKQMVGKVAKLEFRFAPRPGAEGSKLTLKNKDGTSQDVEDEVAMSGDAIDSARATIHEGQVEVSLTLTTEGGRTFRRITSDNVGRQLAIVLDNIVYSAPRIDSAITAGQAVIHGGFTFEEADQLAKVLRAGALPAPLIVMEERVVGPTLGQESINKAVMAIALGMFAIAVFVSIYYKKSGLVALLSLVVNILIMLAALAAFGATLTLPGLAGLALTIGMAVDSNVIIFERIRDELRLGAGRDVAVKSGFDRAMSAIMDSNITTLITGVILYICGTGAVRGFSVTLCIGVITTVFCATYFCRTLFGVFELRDSKKPLSI